MDDEKTNVPEPVENDLQEQAEQSENRVEAGEPCEHSTELSHNLDLGKRGENAAAAFLERRGLDIVDRNWRCRYGEVDIVARDEDSLRFVEVKTRSNCEHGFPAEAVTSDKRARYERIAAQYLKGYEQTDIGVCFDIISIVVTGRNRAFLRLHRNAFTNCD